MTVTNAEKRNETMERTDDITNTRKPPKNIPYNPAAKIDAHTNVEIIYSLAVILSALFIWISWQNAYE